MRRRPHELDPVTAPGERAQRPLQCGRGGGVGQVDLLHRDAVPLARGLLVEPALSVGRELLPSGGVVAVARGVDRSERLLAGRVCTGRVHSKHGTPVARAIYI